MNDVEVLLKEGQKIPVKIQGETFQLGRLGFIQGSKIIKYCIALSVKYKDRLKSMDVNKLSNAEDFMQFMDIIDEEETLTIISMIINKDMEFCRKIDFIEGIEVCRVFIDFNMDELQVLLKNWSSTIKRMTEAVKNFTKNLQTKKIS